MERLTANIEGKAEMICRFEDCMTDEDICPYTNERDCPCMQAVIEKLAQYEDAEERGNGWIPCSERFPEENSNVIACFAHGLVTELSFLDGLFHGIYDYNTNVIIAWQPLPDPYQPKGE